MDTFVFCLSSSQAQAETIIRKLKSAGFADDDISALLPDTTEASGASMLDGLSGLIIPGLGYFIASGPITEALGDELGLPSGLTNALIMMGLPEHDAARFETKVKEGQILISALATDSTQSRAAEEIFRNSRATNVTICYQADPELARFGSFDMFRRPTRLGHFIDF